MSTTFTKVSKIISQRLPVMRAMNLVNVALIGSSALFGCNVEDIPVSGPPNHLINDSHDNQEIKLFDHADIVGQYLTGSSVTFTLERINQEGGEQINLDGLTIESSDPSLLRISEGAENCVWSEHCEDSDEHLALGAHAQSFDVLGSGAVTLTFKDGDETVLNREIQLREANTLKLHRNVPQTLVDTLGTSAGQGEKVLVGSEFTLRLRAMIQGESAEKEIDISRLTQLSGGEGFELKQSDPSRMGVRLHITPESEGELRIPVQAGGQSLEMNFTVVAESEIASLSIDHELLTDSGGEQTAEDSEIPNAKAFALAKDQSGAPIYGTPITWEQLDGESMDANVVDTHIGSQLNFVYDESAQVPFKVTTGELSEIVMLPAQLDTIYSGDAFADGCDAQGDISGNILLAVLLMGLVLIRRKEVA